MVDSNPTRPDVDVEPAVETNPDSLPLRDTVETAAREAVERALAETDGNVGKAAAALGILRTSLYRMMKRYGMPTSSRPKA